MRVAGGAASDCEMRVVDLSTVSLSEVADTRIAPGATSTLHAVTGPGQ